LAIGSVVEGSATALMYRYMQQEMATGAYDAKAVQAAAAREAKRSAAFFEAPPYFRTLAATYICGQSFLRKGRSMLQVMNDREDRGVGEALRDCVQRPPQSSEQILHPEKYWDADLRDEPVRIVDAKVDGILQAASRSVVHRDTVGELLCAILTRTDRNASTATAALMSNPSWWTNSAAKGWGGDRFFLVAHDGAAEVPLVLRAVWITAWDTTTDRDEFTAAHDHHQPQAMRSMRTIGARVAVYYYGWDAAAEARLHDELQAVVGLFTREGGTWDPMAAGR
jgi:hypothetical protein